MDTNYDDRNKAQIIRVDARGCFVEAKNDAFNIGKVHLEFATYDSNKPAGQRQTNHVHIYLDMPEFLYLACEAVSGQLGARARRLKANKDTTPLYQCLGGTSADKLKQYGRARPDGKSLSRTVKLLYSDKKEDFYLFIADSGPGETDAKGLIVPRFGNKPENHVAVSMNERALTGLLIMAKTHYEAWLSAKYMLESSDATGQNTQKARNAQNARPDKVRNPPPAQAQKSLPAAAGFNSPFGNSSALAQQDTEIRMF